MAYRGRLALAASLLLPGMLTAQEPPDPMRAKVLREAERYVHCWTSNDVACVAEMTAQRQLAAAGLLEEELARVLTRVTVRAAAVTAGTLLHELEVAEPWPPFAVGDELFSFVPYYELAGPPRGAEGEVMSYLIGVSEDGGQAWRFIMMSDYSKVRPDEIDRVIPGYGDGPRPEIYYTNWPRRPMSRTRWVDTTGRRFVYVEEAFAYAMAYEIRSEYQGTIELLIRHDNPADRHQPLEFRDSLEPDERVLEWQSAPLRDFEEGELYEVVLEGRRADTGGRLFTHSDELLFEPTSREYWLAVLSKPPATAPGATQGP